MATLQVRNVPEDLYEALRKRAKAQRRSIAAEVRMLLEQNVPTAKELRARRRWFRRIVEMRAKTTNPGGDFPSTEEMIREDRER